MQLFYTTSKNDGTGPDSPSFSLGGYVSSLQVVNADLNNLFGELSLYGEMKATTEYRAIVLKNESDSPAVNVVLELGFSENNVCSFSMAPVAMTLDSEQRYVMESIPTIYSKPFVGEFIGAGNQISIGDVAPGVCVGIWFRREVDKIKVKNEYDNIATPLPEKPYWYEPVQKADHEIVDFTVTWE